MSHRPRRAASHRVRRPGGHACCALRVDVNRPEVLIAEVALEDPFIVSPLDGGLFVRGPGIGRDERDAPAVGRPGMRSDAFFRVGQLPGLAAIAAHHVNLTSRRVLAGARPAGRHETEVAAVRRPLRLGIATFAERDLSCRATPNWHLPDARPRLHAFLVSFPLTDGVDDRGAVGRDHRRADSFHPQDVIDGDGTVLRQRRRRGEHDDERGGNEPGHTTLRHSVCDSAVY